MNGLLQAGALERECAAAVRECYRLLGRADALRDRIDAAQADGDEGGVQVNLRALQPLARQFTRAQAVLVHPTDRRYSAARQVIGYCDEADGSDPRPTFGEREWSVRVPSGEAA